MKDNLDLLMSKDREPLYIIDSTLSSNKYLLYLYMRLSKDLRLGKMKDYAIFV